MALQHHLSITSDWIPELDATILGATHDPLAIGREADTKNKVLRKTRLVWRSSGGSGRMTGNLTVEPK